MKHLVWMAAACLLSICVLSERSAAQAKEEQRDGQEEAVRDISLANGQIQRVLFVRSGLQRGVLVMMPGGEGEIGLEDDGELAHGNNFVVRTRGLWADRGYSVVIVDALGGRNMRGLRSSDNYARVIDKVVEFARAETRAPVFLLGTSQGSIAAMNGAAHLPAGALGGVVLTESVSRPSKSGETVFDAFPERVKAPALIVANQDSVCRAAPAADAPRIAEAMSGAPEVRVIYVNGGIARSQDCGSLSPHGYYGIEQEVVDKIAAWLDAHR